MRTFIAVEIPEEVKKRIAEIGKDIKDLRRVESKNMHVTVSFLGEIESVECVGEVLKEVAKDFKPFNISATGLGVFPNKNYIKVVWIGLEKGKVEIVEMSRRLKKILWERCGISAEEEDIPHITLARVKFLEENEKKNILRLLEENKDKIFGEWSVEKIFLKKSTLTPKGPVYETIEGVNL